MSRLVLLVLIVSFYIVAVPATAQHGDECPTASGEPPVSFIYEPTDEEDISEIFSTQITSYLNTTATTEGLTDAIAATSGEAYPIVNAEVFKTDITGDEAENVVVSVNMRWGGRYSNILSVYGCADNRYLSLATVVKEEFIDFRENPPSSVVMVEDMNGNGRADIVQRFALALNRPAEEVIVYEWENDELTEIFTTGYVGGQFSSVEISNRDDNEETLELVIGHAWSPNDNPEVARSLEQIYAWDEYTATYELICQSFPDVPNTRYEALQSAETQRSCGHFDRAMEFYQLLIDDIALEGWKSEFAVEIPTDIEDTADYVAQIERDYVRAFAYYRMIQLHLLNDDAESADMILEIALTEYSARMHGFQYVLMAETFFATYSESSDQVRACEAATVVFEQSYHSADDPGYAPYIEQLGDGSTFEYDFYYADGSTLSSDPDNMFAVPEEIADVIQIPICIQ